MIKGFEQKEMPISSFNIVEDSIFLTCISFEDRSISLLKSNFDKINKIYAFSLNNYNKTEENFKVVSDIYEEKLERVILDITDPIQTYKMISNITKFCGSTKNEIIVDITTFTHETLLILMQSLKKSGCTKVHYVYVGADEYSIGDSYDAKWLSKGCKEIRNVLGYAGKMIPSKQTCLVMLTGFEIERAMGAIFDLDAELVYIGNGLKESSHVTGKKHVDTMSYFRELYGSLLSTREGVKFFEFSPKDIVDVYKKLQTIIDATPNYNHIIVPLNTKISSLAVGLYALQNRDVQVSYSLPETYNVNAYSTAGDKVVECFINMELI